MNSVKKKRLEASGWKVGSTSEFLNLSTEEAAYVELKLALSKAHKTIVLLLPLSCAILQL